MKFLLFKKSVKQYCGSNEQIKEIGPIGLIDFLNNETLLISNTRYSLV